MFYKLHTLNDFPHSSFWVNTSLYFTNPPSRQCLLPLIFADPSPICRTPPLPRQCPLLFDLCRGMLSPFWFCRTPPPLDGD
ncbi:unnamed protein product [Meloidogyne enterolobii]|uniref:Uncharacterized protein n=1 Tax=Meloidogyne enterolobii TaxID=390850 RepID=A0ACB1AID7_MELEN